MSKLSKLFAVASCFLLVVISFSSVVYLYDTRSKIIGFIKESIGYKTSYGVTELDSYWAKQVMNGGYILHFRHAERDKWIDVQMYDALESDVHNNGSNESRYAEEDYFSAAVCLNERGKIQAKAIGETIKHIGLPIGDVHSSVSCRARQTTELAFGGFDKLHRILVHKGPYNEDESSRVDKLRDLYLNFASTLGKNTIVSAHNSVISCKMFINDKCPSNLELEEGGFYVIRKTTDGLVFEHEFNNFTYFSKVFFER
jgi:phosphohistidine phosphatase SixA